jgi:hypothetical protein
MADRPATQTQPLTRAQISEWLGGNPRMVRWFEAAIRDISSILPDAVAANSSAAESAQVTADAARIVADEALDLIEESSAGAETALAISQANGAEIQRLWAAVGSGSGGGSGNSYFPSGW